MEQRSCNKFLQVLNILILIVTILLNWGQGHLADSGVLYSDITILIKICMTYIICPVSLIFSYNDIVKTKLADRDSIGAATVAGGILFLMIMIIFTCRMIFFVVIEDRKEVPLEDGRILISHENFNLQQPEYYQGINVFVYKEIKEEERSERQK